jgi:hypothetical protein
VIDPKLRDSRHKYQQTQEEFFGWLRLLTREDEHGEAKDKKGKNRGANDPPVLHGFGKGMFRDGPARFRAGHALADQSPALEKVPHIN